MTTRRTFLKAGGLLGAGLALSEFTGAVPWTRIPMAYAGVGSTLEKYMQPVPLPGNGIVVATPSGTNQYSFIQKQISKKLHPQLPPTPLWAYDDGSGLAGQDGSFGMAVVAKTGTPIKVSFTNKLPATYPSWIPVDTRLTPLGSQVRVMSHLHGGFVAAASDGNPTITPNGFGYGQTQTVSYPNQAVPLLSNGRLSQEGGQPASLLWFHDHGMGTTRLNVFAGLAAAYLVRDQFDTGAEPNPAGIPGGPYEVPLVIQDRQFNADGTFLYPTSSIPGVTWIGEYFGDVMLVNGKVWPFLEVEPRLYRFRILNGCNARILDLTMSGVPMWQIGAEGGLWDVPVPVKALVLAPAERADVVADFRGLAGQTLTLKNSNPPSPVVTPAPPLTSVMQLRVGTKVTQQGPTTIPKALPGRAANLPAPSAKRFITLNEADIDSPEWELTLNGTGFDDAPATETPTVGTTEDWYYINLTGDTHPMHLHLVTFQVIGRVPFDAERYTEDHEVEGAQGVPGGIDPTPYATGPMMPPDPTERGFKDTVKANPGTFTIIRAKFELPTGVKAPQTYVHHCHIVEHEDNDMMRPFAVTR
jgi:spore coat protein A, manganese oxidase